MLRQREGRVKQNKPGEQLNVKRDNSDELTYYEFETELTTKLHKKRLNDEVGLLVSHLPCSTLSDTVASSSTSVRGLWCWPAKQQIEQRRFHSADFSENGTMSSGLTHIIRAHSLALTEGSKQLCHLPAQVGNSLWPEVDWKCTFRPNESNLRQIISLRNNDGLTLWHLLCACVATASKAHRLHPVALLSLLHCQCQWSDTFKWKNKEGFAGTSDQSHTENKRLTHL